MPKASHSKQQFNPIDQQSCESELQDNLLKQWTKEEVSQAYQNVFLNFLDKLEPSVAKHQIKKQLTKTIKQTSLYSLLKQNISLRECLVSDVEHQIDLKQKIMENQGQLNLGNLCEQLSTLRKLNLILAEIVLSIFENFKLTNSHEIKKWGSWFVQLLGRLNEDHQLLKESFLQEYIIFDSGFDPFLLAHYQMLKRNKRVKIIKNQFVNDLFDIKIGQVYRMMRCKEKMLKYLVFADKNRTLQAYQFQHDSQLSNYRKGRLQLQPVRNNQREESQSTNPLKRGRSLNLPSPLGQRNPMRSSGSMRMRSHDMMASSVSTVKNIEPISFKFSKNFQKLNKKPEQESNNLKLPHIEPKRSHQIEKSPQNFAQFRRSSFQTQKTHESNLPDSRLSLNHPKLSIKRDMQHRQLASGETPRQINQENGNQFLRQRSSILNRSNQKIWNKKQQLSERAKNKKIQIFLQKNTDRYGSNLNDDEVLSTIYAKVGKDKDMDSCSNSVAPQDLFGQLDRKSNQSRMSFEKQMSKGKQKFFQKNQNQRNIHKKNQEGSSNQPTTPNNFRKNIINKNSEILKKEKNSEQKILKAYRPNSAKKQAVQRVSAEKNNTFENAQSKSQQENILHSRKIQPKNSQEKSSSQNQSQILKKTEVKMVPAKLPVQDFQKYFQNCQFLESHPCKSQINGLKLLVRDEQAYLSEFHLNNKLAVSAICCPSPNNSLVIRLWAPYQVSCNLKLSNFFFEKYIDYLEKQSTVKNILYHGGKIPELALHKFMPKSESQNTYVRERKVPISRQSFEFESFFSIQICNISFLQPDDESWLFSDEIEPFTASNSWINPRLIEHDPELHIPKELQHAWLQDKEVSSIQKVNKILESDSYDIFETNEEHLTEIKKVSMTRCMLSSSIKQNFIAYDGYMMVKGHLLKQVPNYDGSICRLQLNKQINLYFCSADSIGSVKDLSEKVKRFNSKGKTLSECKFAFKMFSKQFYGRFDLEELVEQGQSSLAQYGNWDVNFAWRDQIAGKITHHVQEESQFQYGEKGSFYVTVEMSQIGLFGFEITEEDFLY